MVDLKIDLISKFIKQKNHNKSIKLIFKKNIIVFYTNNVQNEKSTILIALIVLYQNFMFYLKYKIKK